jgi:cytochrome c oxidase subunit II
MKGYPQTTFEPVTEFGRLLNDLFANTFWWTIGIMVLVEILLVFFVIKFRDRPGAPEPKHIHGHTGLEIGWTLIPAIIVLFIAVPTIRGVFATQRPAPDGALIVEVIGHQWWWEFRYPQLGVVTANELVLPTGRAIDLQMHSADVVHSFWVPRIGGKRDVNPQPRTVEAERARVNHIEFANIEKPGYYLGQCAEFCGASHALMRTAIVAMTEPDFDTWAKSMAGGMPVVNQTQDIQHGPASAEKIPPQAGEAGAKEGGSLGMATDTLNVTDSLRAGASAGVGASAQQRPSVNALSPTGAPAPGRGVYQDLGPVPPGSQQLSAMYPGQPSLEQRGKQIFTSRACVACHTVSGTTAQGKIGPNLTRFGSRRSVGAGTAYASLENVEKWIHNPKSMKPGVLMPGAEEGAGGMPATGLNAEEIRAVAAYLKSLK